MRPSCILRCASNEVRLEFCFIFQREVIEFADQIVVCHICLQVGMQLNQWVDILENLKDQICCLHQCLHRLFRVFWHCNLHIISEKVVETIIKSIEGVSCNTIDGLRLMSLVIRRLISASHLIITVEIFL